MKSLKSMFLSLAAIPLIAVILPLSGCSILGIEESEDESIGTVSNLDAPVDKRIYTEALRIADNLKTTAYQSEYQIKESSGTYKVDNAGLVNYVLERAAAINYAKITKDVDGPLTAEHYYAYFTGLNASTKAPAGSWCRIISMANARPGDIIVIEHQNAGQPGAGPADHVLIIVDTPVPEDNVGYSVLVVDAAMAGHDNDTRESDGVGKGIIYFGLDKDGAPFSYRWNDPLAAPLSQGLIGIAIGRAG